MLEKFAGAVITLSHSPTHDDLTDLLFIKNIQSADEISHSANDQKSVLVTFEHDIDQKQLTSIAEKFYSFIVMFSKHYDDYLIKQIYHFGMYDEYFSYINTIKLLRCNGALCHYVTCRRIFT